MGDLHAKFIDLYNTSLDEFCNLIDKNYENKEEIITQCKHIKYKLSYTAPEIINHTFGYELNRITPIIPPPGTEWIDKGWKILIQTYNKGLEITKKEYSYLN